MKTLLVWSAALPPAVIFALASQQAFSVNDDILAFPQYEVQFQNEYIHWDDAVVKLREQDRGIAGSNTDLGKAKAKIDDDKTQHTGEEVQDVPVAYERMVLDGHDFLCSIPAANTSTVQKQFRNETLVKVEKEKELARAVDRGWELLSGMQDRCIYFMEGWWSYRFCYGKGVKQFHQLSPSRGGPVYPPVEDPNVAGYELGIYRQIEGQGDDVHETSLDAAQEDGNVRRQSGVSAQGEIVERGETRYLVQRLGGGTQCDITLKDRTIEVQFHCNPQSADRIMVIKEKATCAYQMVIHTPRLCHDVAFLPPQKDQPNAIQCRPILEEDEIDAYEQDLEDMRNTERKEKINRASNDIAAVLGLTDPPKKKQFVGDIEVGGHHRIPKDKPLESGAIVGGGKEKFVETIATSEGKILTAEDLKRLKLGEMEGIKELERQVKKHAGGKKWKLDLMETPQGRREFRAIIGDDTDGESKDKVGAEKTNDKESEQRSPSKSKDEDTDGTETGSEEEFYKQEL